MNQHRKKTVRRIACIMTMGTLLQAGGCTVDTTAIGQGILSSVLSAVVGGFVCDTFNVSDAACIPNSSGFGF